MSRILLACALGTAYFAVAAVAHAGVVVFKDEASFFGAAAIESTETFDDFQIGEIVGIRQATIDGVTYFTPGDAFREPKFGPERWQIDWGIGTNLLGDNYLLIDGGFTHALGFELLANPNGDEAMIITVTMVTGEEHVERVTRFDFQPVTEPDRGGTFLYRGYFSAEGIASIKVADDPTIQESVNWQFDNVSRGVIVPETSSFLAWSLVLLSVSLACGRCRKRPQANTARIMD